MKFLITIITLTMMTGAFAQEKKLSCVDTNAKMVVVEIWKDGIVAPYGDRVVGALGAPTDKYFATIRNYDDLFYDVRKEHEYTLAHDANGYYLFNDLKENIMYMCKLLSDEQDVEEIKVSGKLFSLYAIGGETTGIGLRDVQGKRFELKGKTRQIHKMLLQGVAVGSEVVVYGYFTTVRGVEIPSRKVFVVTSVRTFYNAY